MNCGIALITNALTIFQSQASS